jgi:hypothetical protein
MWSLPEILEMNREPRLGEPTNRDGLPIPKRRGDTVDPVKGFLRRKALFGGKAPRGTYIYISPGGTFYTYSRHDVTLFMASVSPVTFESYCGGVKINLGNHYTLYWFDEEVD